MNKQTNRKIKTHRLGQCLIETFRDRDIGKHGDRNKSRGLYNKDSDMKRQQLLERFRRDRQIDEKILNSHRGEE